MPTAPRNPDRTQNSASGKRRARVTRLTADGRRRNVFAEEPKTAPDVRLSPAPPTRHPGDDPDFNPLALASEHEPHDLAHRGIHTITLPDGRKTAWNTNGPQMTCPNCRAEKTKQATCSDCFGRGITQSVPFCERPWDEVVTTEAGGALFLGGHDAQTGDCRPADQFDVVISLYTRDGFEPHEPTEHHTHTMIDGPLDPADHDRIHELAEHAAAAIEQGKRVLVRCQAGMNRSGLVAALAMMRRGWHARDAIDRMRAARGPYVLFNDDFVAHLYRHQRALDGDGAS